METIRDADAYRLQALATVIAGTHDGGEEVLERAGRAEDRAEVCRWDRGVEAAFAAHRAVLAGPR